MSDASLPPAARGTSAGDPPMLWIDWGCRLEIGANLQPVFHLYCPGTLSRPRVTVHVDPRLDHAHWVDTPPLKHEGPGLWSFVEPLEMTADGERCKPGQYGLELRVVFHEPGQGPRCYRAHVPIVVKDPAEQPTGPVLEIEGGRLAMVNLMGRDLSEFSRILLKVDESGVVNVQESLYPADPTPGPAGPPTHVSRTLLKPDLELQSQMPRPSAHGPRVAMNRAALVLDDGRRILLVARPTVVLGRGRLDEQAARVSDICLRLGGPASAEQNVLSAYISRLHLRMTLHADGLHILDESTWGTYYRGEKLCGPLVLGAAHPRLTLAVAGLLGLELSAHCDPAWSTSTHGTSLVEEAYQQLAGSSTWNDARSAGLDAVRIQRHRRLPIDDHWRQLSRGLPAESWQAIQEAADSLGRIDRLAQREQYVLVFRSATVGGSPATDPICLDESGLGPAHARILHLGGVFFLEALTDDGQMAIDGRPLAAHELAPLAPGARMSLGRTPAQFVDAAAG
jgi:hypothetical protein